MEPNKLFEQLKQLKPDEHYTLASRARILQFTPHPAPKPTGFLPWLTASMRFGSAVALTGLLILVAAGSVSYVFKKLLSPLDSLVSLNPDHIRAEARDIDAMQIQLGTLDYEEAATPAGQPKRAPSISTLKKISQIHPQTDKDGAAIEGTTEKTTSSASTADESAIDAALDELTSP